jgi:hypothetical protein
MARISEDGQAVFVLEDRYRRFLVHNAKAAPEEDLLLIRTSSGKHAAYTTSQFAHISLAERGTSVSGGWPPRLALAPSKDQILLGIPVGRDVWLVNLDWNGRGKSPNKTQAIKSEGNRLRLLAAQIVNGASAFFVTDGDSISRINSSANRMRLGGIPFDAFDYSPQFKVAIGYVEGRMSAADGAIMQGRLGASKGQSFSVPGTASNREWVFAFTMANQLFGSTDRVYKAVGGNWQPFGSKARLLAISASKEIWLVETENGQMWKVTF